MSLSQGKYERSTLEFDRQLSLAKEINDTPEMAEANLGMGSSYVLRFDFLGAIRYLDIALGGFILLGNVTRQCECLRAMQNCYRRLGQSDRVQTYAERLIKIEGTTSKKLLKIGIYTFIYIYKYIYIYIYIYMYIY
jgi:tetratricopeptide (TPR) repeat protein